MVVDPAGGVHYLKVKTRIGRKNGFVAAIREGEVVVTEYNTEENGQYTKIFKVLELR
jgi:type IV pilus assembly protein PilP